MNLLNDNPFVPGLTVGHWRLVEYPKLAFKKGCYVVRCVSRCGVELPVRLSELKQGRPFTCEACRPGMTPPPPSRVSPQQDWSVIMAVELVNPRSLEQDSLRNGEWPKAKRLLELSLDGTQFGPSFGWRVYVKSGHKHKKAKKHGLQILEANDKQRQVRLRLRVEGSPIQWDLNLQWVRQDVDARRVVDVMKALANSIGQPEDDGPAEEEFTAEGDETFGAGIEREVPLAAGSFAPATPSAAVAFIPNLDDRLGRVKSGLDRMMEANRDMGALLELKADAIKRERESATALVGPRDEYNRLTVRQAEVSEECQALGKQVAELREKLKRTERAWEEAQETHSVLATDILAAGEVYRPLQLQHDEAVANLRQVEANERERAVALQRVPELAALLAAFEKLGG